MYQFFLVFNMLSLLLIRLICVEKGVFVFDIDIEKSHVLNCTTSFTTRGH